MIAPPAHHGCSHQARTAHLPHRISSDQARNAAPAHHIALARSSSDQITIENIFDRLVVPPVRSDPDLIEHDNLTQT